MKDKRKRNRNFKKNIRKKKKDRIVKRMKEKKKP